LYSGGFKGSISRPIQTALNFKLIGVFSECMNPNGHRTQHENPNWNRNPSRQNFPGR